jgi:hypothetical protein
VSKYGPMVAWIEDDDSLREQIMVQTGRELPEVVIHFSSGISGFWICLHDFDPCVLVIDVMLPYLPGVKRLSEGVYLADWVRKGEIPCAEAASLQIPPAKRVLLSPNGSVGRYAKVPIVFCSGRSEARLRSELDEKGVHDYTVFEKGRDDDESAVDRVIEFIRECLSGV